MRWTPKHGRWTAGYLQIPFTHRKVKEKDLNQSSMCKMFTLRIVFLHSWEVNKMCLDFKALFSTSWHSFEPWWIGKITRWWFQIFFISTSAWGRLPFWLIFSIGLNHQLDKKRGPSDWFSNVIPCHTGSWQIRQGMVGPLPQQEQPCTTEAPVIFGGVSCIDRNPCYLLYISTQV